MSLRRSQMPSFQALAAFEAAGRHGSFTMAAEELALTQSAVSKQVLQLENTLGIVLFDRTKGKITLTAPGERYLRAAKRLLEDYAKETHAVIASAGSETTLNIAVLPTFASRWLIPRLPTFLARHPSLTINLTTELKPFDFADKLVHAAIHYGSPNWPNAELFHLLQESIVAVTSPDYAQARNLHRATDLPRAVLLQLATRPNFWSDWFEAMKVEHPYPYRGPIFDQFTMMSEAAAVGMGVALMPRYLVERELQSGTLVALDEDPYPGSGNYYVATPLKTQHEPVVAHFVKWTVSEAKGTGRRA